MSVQHVTDPEDPRVVRFHRLRDAELLASHGLFVAEGRVVVERVLTDRRYPVEQLLLAPGPWSQLRRAIEACAPQAEVFLLDSPSAFGAVTGFNLHRGCLALVRRPAPLPWTDVVHAQSRCVVLEAVSNADNVGSVFRNASAFGAGAVLLSPTCCDPLYRKAIRTSMGATTRVPFASLPNWPGALLELRTLGFVLAALSPRQPSETLDAFALRAAGQRVALIVGTEGAGLTGEVERLVDARVRIPMCDGVDSVNLAVASGIALSRLSGLH